MVAAVNFLGGQIALPLRPTGWPRRPGMPVVVMTAPRMKGGGYELRVARVIQVPPGLGEMRRVTLPMRSSLPNVWKSLCGNFRGSFIILRFMARCGKGRLKGVAMAVGWGGSSGAFQRRRERASGERCENTWRS